MSKIAVIVASLGRPESLRELSIHLKAQSRRADKIIFSVTSEEDIPDELINENTELIFGPKGSCAQRNRGIDHLEDDDDDYETVVFYDDDFVPSRYALERIEQFLLQYPDVVGVTGDVLLDGINDAGVSIPDAREIVQRYDSRETLPKCILSERQGLYGCNMAFRFSAIGDTRFDENLPLYGWLEDNDFSFRLKDKGRLVRTDAFAGVHCGVKAARSPGLRLGYSQIANPLYLGRKGTVPWRNGIPLMFRNIVANIARSAFPEPWIDRWGRLRGNCLALYHLAAGKLRPQNILKL